MSSPAETPDGAWSRARAAIVVSWRFCYRVVEALLEAAGLQHAATIAFFAILSILPFTVIAVGIVARLMAEIHFGADDSAVATVLDPLTTAIPFMDGGMRELVSQLAERPRSLSLVSIFMLLFAAGAGFNAVANGINAVLRTEKRRTFLLTRLMIAGLVILLATAMFVWTVAMQLFEIWAQHLAVALPGWLEEANIIQLCVKFFLLCVGFYFIVKVMATERYPRKHRWIAAAIFAVCFHLAQFGFSVYLTEVTSYDRFYGAAGAFFGLALWLYVTAILMLGACALIRTMWEFRAERANERADEAAAAAA